MGTKNSTEDDSWRYINCSAFVFFLLYVSPPFPPKLLKSSFAEEILGRVMLCLFLFNNPTMFRMAKSRAVQLALLGIFNRDI